MPYRDIVLKIGHKYRAVIKDGDIFVGTLVEIIPKGTAQNYPRFKSDYDRIVLEYMTDKTVVIPLGEKLKFIEEVF